MKIDFKKIANAAAKGWTDATLKAKQVSPKAFLIAGIAGVIVGTVTACVATVGAVDDIQDAKDDLDNIREELETDSENYTEEDAKHDKNTVYARTARSIAKRYLPAVAIIIFSITCIVHSHNIMKARNLALASAYLTESSNFGEYRKRVAEKYGAEAENDIYNDRKTVSIETKTVDENGSEKVENKDITVAGKALGSWTFRFEKYDENGNPAFSASTGDPYTDMMQIKAIQKYMNDKYNIVETIFMNDIFKELGHKRTVRGQSEGWHKISPDDSTPIDFGAHIDTVLDKDGHPYEVVILDFNVMGNVVQGLATKEV